MTAAAETPGATPQGRLILVCGLPGVGKSTLARRLVAELPAVTFCPDDWMVDLGAELRDEEFRYRLEQRFCSLAWELLVLGQSVTLEFGLWGRDERDALRLVARALGVPVELRYLDVPLDELWRRVQARNERGAPGTVVMTRAELEGYADIFQDPDPEELALFDEPHPAGPGKQDLDT